MRFKSYVAKVFVVESSKAIIRDEQFESQKYQAGEALPPGKQVGDVKTIPQRTEIKVTDVVTDSGRHTFVFAAAASDDLQFGWTSSMNLEGGFKNETVGLAPGQMGAGTLGQQHDLHRCEGVHTRGRAGLHAARGHDSC
jgi:hypothetical protein